MRDLNQLAQQSLERRRMKLQGDVFVAERTIIQQLAPRGLGGNAVKAVLANYENVIKDLVEHRAGSHAWVRWCGDSDPLRRVNGLDCGGFTDTIPRCYSR